MNSKSVVLHPEYPDKVWIVVEQPRDEPMRYEPVTGTFGRSVDRSLLYHRGFSGAYGWVGAAYAHDYLRNNEPSHD